jgi:SAM-dependent methyltransferase
MTDAAAPMQRLLAEYLDLSLRCTEETVTSRRVLDFVADVRAVLDALSSVPALQAQHDALRLNARVGMRVLLQRAPWLDADARTALEAFVAASPPEMLFLGKYRITLDVVFDNFFRWPRYFSALAGRPDVAVLEIGCFEGQTAAWLLENVLQHESSRLTVVDPFDYSGQVGVVPPELVAIGATGATIEARFDENMQVSGASHRVTKIVGRSQSALRALPLESYDAVYVDGSHATSDVLEDAVLSWRLVKPGGLVLFDDYYETPGDPALSPKRAIDAFLDSFAGAYEEIDRAGQQLVIARRPAG